jgi:hypothetical protein
MIGIRSVSELGALPAMPVVVVDDVVAFESVVVLVLSVIVDVVD